MFHFGVALVWSAVAVAMHAYGHTLWWFALVLAGYNVIRGAVRLYLNRPRRPKDDDYDLDGPPPPAPVVHPEFKFDDETKP